MTRDRSPAQRSADRRWWLVGLLMFALGAGSAGLWWLFETFPDLLPHLPRLLP